MSTDWDLEEAGLRRAAADLRERLGLHERLGRIGSPTLTGSAALRVMVARDVDVTVTVPVLDAAVQEQVASLAADLSRRPDVREVLVRDDTGRWNTDPQYPDGVYLRVECADAQQQTWTVDVWFVDEPDRQPDLEHLRTVGPLITPDAQRAILAVKRAGPWRGPDCSRVPSFEACTAVLRHGVRTPDEFRRHLAQAAEPGRAADEPSWPDESSAPAVPVDGKLVRDRVPEIVAAAGGSCVTRVMGVDEHARRLRAKLVEEATEVREATTRARLVEEAGDVLDVLDALLASEGILPEEVDEQRQRKRRSHGGFTRRLLSTEFVATSRAAERETP